MEKKRRHVQGARWRKLDNTAKLFPGITGEDLSNVFRVSVTLKEEVEPALLERALVQVLPEMDGFQVKLRKGVFWYYFETNQRKPVVEEETDYPCRFIDPHSNQLYLFRVTYYKKRINLEVFHALTDGMGAVQFLCALTREYLCLKKNIMPSRSEPAGMELEDGYRKYYRKTEHHKYATKEARQLTGPCFPLNQCSVIHGCAGLKEMKDLAKSSHVSITKYLTALMIWVVYKKYGGEKPIGINLPVNLRAFFDTETKANFFAVTLIEACMSGKYDTFEALLEEVSRQMDEKITKEKLEETISYNVSNEKNIWIRLTPLPIKLMALRRIFKKSSRSYTATLSNIGPIKMEKEYEDQIENFHLLIGVSKRQPFKCGVTAWRDRLVITFSSALKDTGLQEEFFGFLREKGVPVEIESNGLPDSKYDKGMYPQIPYDENWIKRAARIFYFALGFTAVMLWGINWLTYPMTEVWWSLIAVTGIAYAAMTVRYSVVRNSNLAFKLVIQSLGIQLLLLVIDWITVYDGWSVNYAIPSVILFDVIVVAALMVVNRLNWQRYFMYQIALTVFSFMPLLLFWAGWLTSPVLAVITMIVSVVILVITIFAGGKSTRNELKRRFHI